MISTVLFDMGGTIEDLYYGPDTLELAASGIARVLHAHGHALTVAPQEIGARAIEGIARYQADWQKQCVELKPPAIWNTYILKDILPHSPFPLGPDVCEELAHMWEVTYYRRSMRADVPAMLEGLRGLGMRMGVVSNTASLFQVFAVLEAYGIRDYFGDVTLSSITGYRKPDPYIFKVALRQMQADPACCAYVGDTLSRDVIGPRRAGLALTFQIQSMLTNSRDKEGMEGIKPDYAIGNMLEVYTILKDLS